jgi:Flp pilus assembly protein TadB
MSALLALGLATAGTGAALALAGGRRRAERLLGVQPAIGEAALAGEDGRTLSHRAGGQGGRRAARSDEVPLLLELLGAMLEAGLALPRALEVAAGVADGPGPALLRASAALRLGTEWDHAWPDAVPGSAIDELREALGFAASTGAPSAELLYSRARQLRRSRHRELEKRAAALGVRLVIPLGVCSLPAFLCLGVVPVLLAMLPGG